MEEKINNTSFNSVPPHDMEAEQAVLSSMFMDKTAAVIAIENLQGDDFYNFDYKIIFEASEELHNRNIPIDVISVKNKLEEKNLFDKIGGLNTIRNVTSAIGSSVNVKQYCKIIKEKSTLRKLIKLSDNISSLSYDASKSIDDIIEKAEKGIFDILQKRNSYEFTHIKDITLSSFDRLEKIYHNKGKLTGIETGFIDFDSKTSGLQKSDLILIAARPSMGKTAFVLNIAQYAAIKNDIPTAIFSLEMSKEQLVNRMICSEAMIDAQNLRNGNLSEHDWELLVNAIGYISEAPIYIDDTPSISPTELKAKCRKLKLEKGLGLIIIDYIQLMNGNKKSESRQQEISEISRALKAVAREMESPVIALSQLSRACEQRADHRPLLSDLRESGAIEQDADVVAFLYRDEYYFPNTNKKNQAELIIAKQRNGPTGTVELSWLGKYTKFSNLMQS